MKLSIPKRELQRAMGRIQTIVERCDSMPILDNVLLEAREDHGGTLVVAATDLEVWIRSTHPGKVTKHGAISISASTLFEIVRELPDEPVYLQATDRSLLKIRCARARFSLAGTAADKHPHMPKCPSNRLMRISAPSLALMIERTLYAASVDETRYNLHGAFVEVDPSIGRMRMVATDGHRLALAEHAIGHDAPDLASGVIVPRKGLIEIKRLLDEEEADEVEIGFAGNSGLVRRGGVTLVMRLIEGEFPDYRKVIPQSFDIALTLPSEILLHALRRVAVMSLGRSRVVTLELGDRTLTISSMDPDRGAAQEQIDVDHEGTSAAITFNSDYLNDALAALGAKEVRLELRDANSPAQLRPTDNSGAIAVIMPVTFPDYANGSRAQRARRPHGPATH